MTIWPYLIDWSATGAFWSGVGTLGLAAAAFLATNEWKRQYKETRTTEAAVAALAATQEVYAILERIIETASGLLKEPISDNRKLSKDETLTIAVLCEFSASDLNRLRSKIEAIFEAGYFFKAAFGDDFDSLIKFGDAASAQIENLQRIAVFANLRLDKEPEASEYYFGEAFGEILDIALLSQPNKKSIQLRTLHDKAHSALKSKITIYRSGNRPSKP